MDKKYIMTLTDAECATLRMLIMSGKGAARRLTDAPILLKVDKGLPDPTIVEVVEVGHATVERVCRRFVEEGLNAGLDPRRPEKPRGARDRRGAETLAAEVGVDLSRFPSAVHLALWAGMVPWNNESAGKRRSGKTRKWNLRLRIFLVETTHGAGGPRQKLRWLLDSCDRLPSAPAKGHLPGSGSPLL